jgi:hypothetical protein
LDPTRLSLNEAANRISGWTTDSNSIVFASNRDGAWGFYKQPLNSDSPEPIITGLEQIGEASSVTPDGRWVLYITDKNHQDQTSRRQLMRVPIDGGPAEMILSGLLWGIRCAKPPSDTCLLAESSSDYRRLLFSRLDPANGRGRKLFELDAAENANWDLSPDGTQVALFGVEKPVRVKSLGNQTFHEIIPKDWKAMNYVTWSNDSRGLYGSSPTQRGDILLYTDLQGRAHVIWERRGSLATSAVPSPDRRHLAIESWSLNSNVWMLENF